MKRVLLVLVALALVTGKVSAQSATAQKTSLLDGIKAAIQSHLGRPYVWGADGLKSFDCSGFVWRVMYENGILLKRTTARKFYMTLPKAASGDEKKFGTLVFFDDLKHIGIIDDASAFYHAQVSIGTNRSNLTPFWRQKIYGYRKLPY
jgi:cell wall-associated NlpC family hydrolase